MRINYSVKYNSRNRIFFTNPFLKFIISAAPETRTLNLLFTRQLRYQLRQNGILKYGISDSNGWPSVYKTAARNLLCWCRKLINNATYSYSLFHNNLSFLIFLIRTNKIKLPLSPYQRDFLLLKDVRKPVVRIEPTSTAWRAVVIAVTLYGHNNPNVNRTLNLLFTRQLLYLLS